MGTLAKRTREYAENLVEGATPLIERYFPEFGTKLRTWARARAGGTRRHQEMTGLEKAALEGLTKENVQSLSDDDLWGLHKTCHRQAAAMAKADVRLARQDGRIVMTRGPREIQ